MPRRMIDTAIWSDERITELSAHAQLVYLRVILGDDTGPAGATRVTPKRIAVDVNLTREEVSSAIAELTAVDLLRQYDGGWLWLPSFIRYQLAGPPFIRGIRRQAKEAPEALARAITRALDAIVGPDDKRKQPKNSPERPDGIPSSPATLPTLNAATSREDSEGSPTLAEASPEGNQTLREKYQDQDQDRPIGLSVLVPDNEHTPAAAPTEPEPGAQSPPPERDTPPRRPRRGPAADVPHGDLVPLAELMRTAPPEFLRPRIAAAPELTA